MKVYKVHSTQSILFRPSNVNVSTQWFFKTILEPYLKSQPRDFSDGSEIKNLPSNAGIRRFDSIPGWGTKMPYAAEQLIPHA